MAKDTDKKIARSKEYEKLKESLKARFISSAHIMFGRDIHELPMNEIYKTVAAVAKQWISEYWIKTNKAYMDRQEKQVYYFSIEFLMGRLLKANLINLGIDEAFREVLEDLDLNLDDIYEEEPDAGLGNGGLGRLAACFIDSLAAHRLPCPVTVAVSVINTDSLNRKLFAGNKSKSRITGCATGLRGNIASLTSLSTLNSTATLT